MQGSYESEESSEEVLTMKTVRFSSCVILPSQKNYCSLEYQAD
jgi:hypothetical protein